MLFRSQLTNKPSKAASPVKASEKPYLRLQIPEQPEVRVMNFDPEAKWPQ